MCSYNNNDDNNNKRHLKEQGKSTSKGKNTNNSNFNESKLSLHIKKVRQL